MYHSTILLDHERIEIDQNEIMPQAVIDAESASFPTVRHCYTVSCSRTTMAGSSSSVSWTPASGRHAVNIGPSLAKALKARKLKASPGAPATTKKSNLPERDFYSFRCMFIRNILYSSR